MICILPQGSRTTSPHPPPRPGTDPRGLIEQSRDSHDHRDQRSAHDSRLPHRDMMPSGGLLPPRYYNPATGEKGGAGPQPGMHSPVPPQHQGQQPQVSRGNVIVDSRSKAHSPRYDMPHAPGKQVHYIINML